MELAAGMVFDDVPAAKISASLTKPGKRFLTKLWLGFQMKAGQMGKPGAAVIPGLISDSWFLRLELNYTSLSLHISSFYRPGSPDLHTFNTFLENHMAA